MITVTLFYHQGNGLHLHVPRIHVTDTFYNGTIQKKAIWAVMCSEVLL